MPGVFTCVCVWFLHLTKSFALYFLNNTENTGWKRNNDTYKSFREFYEESTYFADLEQQTKPQSDATILYHTLSLPYTESLLYTVSFNLVTVSASINTHNSDKGIGEYII